MQNNFAMSSYQLTDREKDDINVLLTEVSLELLGNQFFDIFGQKRDSLRELYQPFIAKRDDYAGADDCELVKQLNTPAATAKPAPSPEASPMASPAVPATSSRQRKRTASESADNAPKAPEAKQSKPAAAADDTNPSKSRERPTAVAGTSGFKRIGPTRRHTVSRSTAPISQSSRTLAIEREIKKNVTKELNNKHAISERLKIKHFLSEKSRMDTEYMDEYEIVSEFHQAEKKQLKTDSDALIQMVNMIKLDKSNEHKIAEISANILNVKDFL